jgi:hypothetical protein
VQKLEWAKKIIRGMAWRSKAIGVSETMIYACSFGGLYIQQRVFDSSVVEARQAVREVGRESALRFFDPRCASYKHQEAAYKILKPSITFYCLLLFTFSFHVYRLYSRLRAASLPICK